MKIIYAHYERKERNRKLESRTINIKDQEDPRIEIMTAMGEILKKLHPPEPKVIHYPSDLDEIPF